MSFEIKTPLLAESVEAARFAIGGIKDASLEPRQAAVIIGGARVFQSAVSHDIKARLAAPKLMRAEASKV